MEVVEESSRREACRQLVGHLRKVGKKRKDVQRKFLAAEANAGRNVEEAKVTDFAFIFWQQKWNYDPCRIAVC